MYTTIAGIMQEERKIQGIASNISNVSTTGFKRQMVITNEYNNEKGKTPDKLTFMKYDMSQGSITQTGDIMDFAVQGNGFFRVELPDGSTGYARGGAFGINENNQLITNEGYPILAQNNTTNAYEYVVVRDVDTLSTTRTGDFNLDGTDYSFNLVDFEDYQQMERYSSNAFRTEQEELAAGDFAIYQGYQEMSNVDAAQEFTELLIANRQLQANYNALKTVDELVQKNIEEVGKL
jgi:flagellar basal body rod protein FlgG